MRKNKSTTDGIRSKKAKSFHLSGIDKKEEENLSTSSLVDLSLSGGNNSVQEEIKEPDLPLDKFSAVQTASLGKEEVDREEKVEAESKEEEILMTEPEVRAEEFFRKGSDKRDIWIPPVPYTSSLSRRFFLGGITGLIFFAALIILLSTVFARATVSVKPQLENILIQDILIGLDTSISKVLSEGRILPSERLVFTRKEIGEFEATGKEIIAEKARGKAKIYNSFSSSPQSLVANTRFLTSAGVLYRLPQSITVPGARIEAGKIVPQFVEVELVADKAGEESNLSGEVRLNIPGFHGTPKYEGFYALAPNGFSGGLKGEVTVVSPDDIKRGEEAVTKKLYEELTAEMLRKTPPEFTFVEKLREIEIIKVISPRPGTRRDKFTVEAEAEGRAFFFREADLISLLREMVLKGDKTRELVDKTAVFRYQIRSVDYENGKATLTVNGSIKSKSTIPESEIRMLVKGKKEGSIAEVLKSRQEVAQFSISIFPPWRSSAPDDESKIRIIVEEPAIP